MAAASPSLTPTPTNVKASGDINVGIGEMYIFSSEDKQVYSEEFGSCVAVVVHRKDTGAGMLCHLERWQYDSEATFEKGDKGKQSFPDMWNECLRKIGPGDIEMWLFGSFPKPEGEGRDILGQKFRGILKVQDKRGDNKWKLTSISYEPKSKLLSVCGDTTKKEEP
ncbi:unnamed protein product [Prorocentrum cordatum]|uniref:Uncharacterized protein n=1 Tax=Prorocentrum cordatum TaxID=2364126 RepID=A0ABN9U081_9DINO|nr:unnamed protein product [Polarella glacialis]